MQFTECEKGLGGRKGDLERKRIHAFVAGIPTSIGGTLVPMSLPQAVAAEIAEAKGEIGTRVVQEHETYYGSGQRPVANRSATAVRIR